MTRSHNFIDLQGQRFGALVVLSQAPNWRKKRAMWNCQCDCGVQIVVSGMKLRQGSNKACGLRGHRWTSVTANKWEQRYPAEYQTWSSMRQRCSNPKHHNYVRYKGVKICERWNDFGNFLADMGPRPSRQHTIDRYPNQQGNYEPDNCRWATKKEQSRNMRNNLFVERGGERLLLVDLLDELGINHQLVRSRLNIGWSLEEALTKAKSEKWFVEYQGKRMRLSQAAKQVGMSYATLAARLKKGQTFEQAISSPVRPYQKSS